MSYSAFAGPKGMARIVSWTFRITAAAAFFAAGSAKLAGAEVMVEAFDRIGVGQWFRILTGVIEIAGAVGLIHPATAAFSGLVLAITMFFAAVTHLTILEGSALPALLLMHISGAVAWLHRGSFAAPRFT